MKEMFCGCSSLISLDLSTFDTLKVTSFYQMFKNCSKLELINLKNANINEENLDDEGLNEIFDSISDNIVIYSKNEQWKELLPTSTNNDVNCIDNNIINILELYTTSSNALYNNQKICGFCGKNYYKKYSDISNNVYDQCYYSPEGFYLDKNNLYYKSCYQSCKTCELDGDSDINNCIECDDNYSNILSNISGYNNCYDNCTYYHYYNEIMDKTFCTHSMNCPNNYNKLIPNKNECINECNRDSIYKYEYNNVCYIKCPNNTINNSYICEIIDNASVQESTIFTNSIDESTINIMSESNTVTNSIDKSTINIISESNTVTNSIDKSTIKIFNESTNTSSLIDIKSEENNINFDDYLNTDNIIYYLNKNLTQIIMDKIKEIISNYNKTRLNYEKYFRFKAYENYSDEIIISLTSTNEQKYKQNENITNIDFKNCEYKLKKSYNISYNESLYLIKIEIKIEGMKIPIIEYELYYPLYNEQLITLNLTICKNEEIDILIPIKINDTLDKHDPYSEYYNNFCSKSTTKSGSDIILKDRRNEFIDNNMTLCEENCRLISYNYTTEKVKCSCYIKIKLPLFESIKFDPKILYSKFTNIKNIMNLNILKCYKDVFQLIYIKNNYGCFIFIFMYFLYFICLIILFCQIDNFNKININNIIKEKKKNNK